jgi:hypothetical protein
MGRTGAAALQTPNQTEDSGGDSRKNSDSDGSKSFGMTMFLVCLLCLRENMGNNGARLA